MNSKSIIVFSFLLSLFILLLISSCAGPVEKLYIEKCSNCHGENGTGKKANVDFTRQKFPEDKIKHSILHGKGEMASIPGIADPEMTQLAIFIQSFYKEQ